MKKETVMRKLRELAKPKIFRYALIVAFVYYEMVAFIMLLYFNFNDFQPFKIPTILLMLGYFIFVGILIHFQFFSKHAKNHK